MTENELYHHGILGMRWGVRRYQNKDGSLTPRGRKRLEQLESEADRLRPKKKEEPPKSTAVSKHPEIDEMDDDTLKAKNNRLNMEKQYDSFFPQKKEPPNPTTDAYKRSDVDKLTDDELNERINRIKLEKQYKDLLPEDRSKGQIFVDDMLKPAIYNQGKKLTEDVLSKGREVLGNYLGDKVKKGLESRLGVSTDDIKKLGSQYKLDDMSKLSTKELEERNKRLKAEKEYLDPNSKKKDGDGGKKDKKSDGEKTVKEEAQSSKKVETAQKKESKKQDTSEQTKEPEKKVETNNYDVDKDKGYHREVATETGRDSDYGMVVYRRNPVVDVMSRWEEAAIANAVVSKKQEKKVEPILRTYSEEQADDFIKKFNKKRTLEAMKHSDDELYHHGVKGQKWGVRRYQNADGTLTAAGRKRITAFSARRQLNKNDIEWTYARTKQKGIERKLKKKGFETIDDEVFVPKHYSGSDKRAAKLVKKYNNLEKDMKRLDKNTWSVIAAAKEKHFDITSKPVKRVASKGELYVTSFLIGAPAAFVLSTKTSGQGYRVKKKGTGRVSLTVGQL